LLPFFKGEMKQSPREGFLYWSDDGDLMAIRVHNWKLTFKMQDHKGMGVWQGGFTSLRLPYMYNLRSDPFERGPESIQYSDWMVHRGFLVVPAQAVVAKWLDSFKEFPPRQKPASFNLDEVMAKMETAHSGQN
jgi:arylsulfatase